LAIGCALINSPPNAAFTATPTSGTAPLPVSFDASGSSDQDGIITSYNWSFGDGQNGSGAGGYHIYQNAGTYTAILTVIDNDGAMDSDSETITVSTPANLPPAASFTASPTSGPATLSVNFSAVGSSDSDGTIVSYSWNFGDGGTGSGFTSFHSYTSVGTYVAVLTVTDDKGATDFATRTITVTASGGGAAPPALRHDPASYTATPSQGVGQLTVSFDASASSDPDGTITAWNWDFGDGKNGSGQQVTHTYTDGVFLVILTVIDDKGATASSSGSIVVFPVVVGPPI